MTDNKLRMDAYYYGFDETGQPDIDLILSAVACAGKSFHHTDQWNDEDSPWPGHSGNSPIEWIANAALSAAQEMARLKAENEALRKDADRYRWLRESGQCEWDASYEKLELRIETPHFDDSNLDACIDAALAGEASHD